MTHLKKFFSSLKKRKELLIIITAALLIELVSVVQHYSTYDLLEEQLEKRAESELTMKAILTRGALNSAEDILENHIWDIRRSLSYPDSMNHAVRRLVEKNRYVCGGFMACNIKKTADRHEMAKSSGSMEIGCYPINGKNKGYALIDDKLYELEKQKLLPVSNMTFSINEDSEVTINKKEGNFVLSFK